MISDKMRSARWANKLTDEERFWLKVDKVSSPKDCWLWTAAKFHFGHGVFMWKDGNKAHRFSFLIHFGYLPEQVNHKPECNTPACVNPEHLYAGTQKENVADRKLAGTEPKSMLGKRHTEEAKRKISIANSGKTRTEEQRAEMSARQTGTNNIMYGKHHKEETKHKIGAANSKLTDVQIRKIKYEEVGPQSAIAKKYGVSQSHISRILRGIQRGLI